MHQCQKPSTRVGACLLDLTELLEWNQPVRVKGISTQNEGRAPPLGPTIFGQDAYLAHKFFYSTNGAFLRGVKFLDLETGTQQFFMHVLNF